MTATNPLLHTHAPKADEGMNKYKKKHTHALYSITKTMSKTKDKQKDNAGTHSIPLPIITNRLNKLMHLFTFVFMTLRQVNM